MLEYLNLPLLDMLIYIINYLYIIIKIKTMIEVSREVTEEKRRQ